MNCDFLSDAARISDKIVSAAAHIFTEILTELQNRLERGDYKRLKTIFSYRHFKQRAGVNFTGGFCS